MCLARFTNSNKNERDIRDHVILILKKWIDCSSLFMGIQRSDDSGFPSSFDPHWSPTLRVSKSGLRIVLNLFHSKQFPVDIFDSMRFRGNKVTLFWHCFEIFFQFWLPKVADWNHIDRFRRKYQVGELWILGKSEKIHETFLEWRRDSTKFASRCRRKGRKEIHSFHAPTPNISTKLNPFSFWLSWHIFSLRALGSLQWNELIFS